MVWGVNGMAERYGVSGKYTVSFKGLIQIPKGVCSSHLRV